MDTAEIVRDGLVEPAFRPAPRRASRGLLGALRPLALYVPTLVAVVALVFALPRALPGDPLLARIDPNDGLYLLDERVRLQFRAYYGLDRPLHEQLAHYVSGLVRGDLGWSIARSTPVSELIAARLPWTLLLLGTSLALASLVSFVAGVTAAWRRGTARDRLLLTTMTGARAIPEYATATLLLVLLAVLVPLFPLAGAREPFATYSSPLDEALDVLHHLALPATALTLALLAGKFLLVRNTMLSALGQDYMLLARAKGLPERTVKYRHGARNALLPFLTVLGVQTGFAVGGAIFVETVFAYPGMGTLILESVDARDYPVLEGCFLVLAAAVLAVNAAVEVLYARLDPRVRAT